MSGKGKRVQDLFFCADAFDFSRALVISISGDLNRTKSIPSDRAYKLHRTPLVISRIGPTADEDGWAILCFKQNDILRDLDPTVRANASGRVGQSMIEVMNPSSMSLRNEVSSGLLLEAWGTA
jgi:hypothetical protein